MAGLLLGSAPARLRQPMCKFYSMACLQPFNKERLAKVCR